MLNHTLLTLLVMFLIVLLTLLVATHTAILAEKRMVQGLAHRITKNAK